MIERERLEKLIDEWARIYTTNRDKVVWCALDNKMYCDDEILYLEDKDDGEILYLKDIFETQAEAEWVAKMHTQRPEFFEPPVFEDICDGADYNFSIVTPDHKKVEIIIRNEHIDIVSIYNSVIDFSKPLTKDNYIKACEYARNLFLGKENENESRN